MEDTGAVVREPGEEICGGDTRRHAGLDYALRTERAHERIGKLGEAGISGKGGEAAFAFHPRSSPDLFEGRTLATRCEGLQKPLCSDQLEPWGLSVWHDCSTAGPIRTDIVEEEPRPAYRELRRKQQDRAGHRSLKASLISLGKARVTKIVAA